MSLTEYVDMVEKTLQKQLGEQNLCVLVSQLLEYDDKLTLYTYIAHQCGIDIPDEYQTTG